MDPWGTNPARTLSDGVGINRAGSPFPIKIWSCTCLKVPLSKNSLLQAAEKAMSVTMEAFFLRNSERSGGDVFGGGGGGAGVAPAVGVGS